MRSVWDDRKAGGYQLVGGLLIDEMTIQVTTDFEYNMKAAENKNGMINVIFPPVHRY